MSILADFLNEQAAKYRSEAPERERKRDEWVQAVERLIGQMEQWLQQADPGHVLRVERTPVEVREFRIGIYTAPGLTITFGPLRVRVLPVARHVVGPMSDEAVTMGRSQGRVDITDGAQTYMLYRYADERGERWVLLDDQDYRVVPFNRDAFESALVSLLQ